MKRDLHADLALCVAATSGPWFSVENAYTWQLFGGLYGNLQLVKAPKRGTNYAEYWPGEDDARFIAESREGWPEAIRRAIAAEAEVVQIREILGSIFAKAQNDVARWDGGMCVGTPVFQDRPYTRRLVDELRPLLFPEVSADVD
ncbi:hypothetical protein [Paenibacillus sp. TC-CSREp1]|uniref:hypothetical protein n=1 Tax=Paenibacillus sp. TC-CSREp1 TaxID=3410089 RepID=UPI003CF29991